MNNSTVTSKSNTVCPKKFALLAPSLTVERLLNATGNQGKTGGIRESFNLHSANALKVDLILPLQGGQRL